MKDSFLNAIKDPRPELYDSFVASFGLPQQAIKFSCGHPSFLGSSKRRRVHSIKSIFIFNVFKSLLTKQKQSCHFRLANPDHSQSFRFCQLPPISPQLQDLRNNETQNAHIQAKEADHFQAMPQVV